MNSIYIISIGLLGLIGWFIWSGYKNRIKSGTVYEFFLMGNRLEFADFSKSYAAASTSVGTVIFFFVILGLTHGFYILFAPITLLAGIFIFNKYLLPSIPDYFFNKTQTHFLGTLGEFIYEKYQSNLVKLIVMALSLFGLLAILIIELFVGVSIFKIYNSELVNNLSLIAIAFVVWIYTSFGGMKAVVSTDKIQFWVLLIPVAFLFLYLGTNSNGFSAFTLDNLFPNPIIFEKGFLLPWPMLLNILIVNLLLTPSLLRTWQMAASSESRENVRKGMLIGALLTVALTTFYVSLGLVFYKGVYLTSSNPSLVNILSTLQLSPEPFLSLVLLPMFFWSCFAAILSTVDSALIPVVHSLWLELKSQRGADMEKIRKAPSAEIPLLGAAVMGFALLLYFAVFKLLQFDLLSWMFTIFTFSIVVSPTVIFALLLDRSVLSSRLGRWTAVISLSVAFVVAIALTLLGNRVGNLAIVQLNSPLGALAGFVPFLALWIGHLSRRTS